MLSFVKKWCFYKINLVHLLFPKVIYILIHILSVFWPNIMFLGAFERVFKGLQKTGLNRSWPVNVNRFFAVFTSQKWKDLTAGPVFCSLGLVWLRSFSGHETRLPNTSPITYSLNIQFLNYPKWSRIGWDMAKNIFVHNSNICHFCFHLCRELKYLAMYANYMR